MSLHPTQTDALLRPIVPERVSKDGKGHRHVQAYDVRRRLVEVFGFGGWSGDVTDLTPIFETENQQGKWTVAYRCTYRVVIHATGASYTEAAMGSAVNQPSRADAHDLAIKTAESQAFKRAAVNLGSQAGLSLYANDNPFAPIVRYVLGDDPARINDDGSITRPQKPAEADTKDHVAAPVAPETPAPQGDDAAAAPPPAAPAGQDTDWAEIIRRRVINEAPAKTGTTRKTFLLKQLTEAATHKVTGSMVNVDGEALTVERLIQNALRAA